MPRLLRITTVPISLHLLLQGQFQFMREHGYEVISMSADGKEVEAVVKDGTQHIVIPFTRKITPIRDFKCLWILVREIKRMRPDIVHTHTPKAGLLGMIAGWLCRVPVRLHTVAGLPLMEASGIKRAVLKLSERITYACAHKIYPNSLGLKAFMLQQFRIPHQKLKIIGNGSSNGIDTDFFQRTPMLESSAADLRARYKLNKDDIVFSFAGRIVRDKGIVELVSAFREISASAWFSNKFPKRNSVLMMVGHFEEDIDPLPAEVLEFLRKDKRVILAGFQPDVRPWLMASDVFVFPSYREGFPNVVMQACLLQIACIVTDINGSNEIVKHDSTGLVVPTKNVAALAQAMKIMAENEEKRTRYAEAACRYVADNFRREFIWEELRKEYARMLANNLRF